MGLNKNPSQREVQKYVNELNEASAKLHQSYLADISMGMNLRTPQEKLLEANLLQAQVTNVLLNQVIQNSAMTVDQLSILVKRREK